MVDLGHWRHSGIFVVQQAGILGELNQDQCQSGLDGRHWQSFQ